MSDKILSFNRSLDIDVTTLPQNVDVLNPFKGENAEIILNIAEQFYGKFYNDTNNRNLILGINPGRLGAGTTGIPFTDTKRLKEVCGIDTDFHLHEPSSVFVYDVISAFGGPKKFYKQFYIGSVCPLGFVTKNKKGNWVNYNYYDDAQLQKAVTPYILTSLKAQIKMGLNTEKVFCLGTGKNYHFLKKFNAEHLLFNEIVPLEHPRYIMQYKSKSAQAYVDKFVMALADL